MKVFWQTRFPVIPIAMAFVGFGCTTRTQILTAHLVSMTETGIKPGQKATVRGASVSSKYCLGDEAISKKANNIGLIDEVVLRAQKQSKARFIADVQIFEERAAFQNPCIILEGIALK